MEEQSCSQYIQLDYCRRCISLVDTYFDATGLYFRVFVFAPCCQYDQIQDRGAVIKEFRE